ncbi:hypothetical protein FDP25_16625 [Roseovarius sp. A21]|uniref:N-acetyltransferase domain-containing protein n=1 Tax=Roseovarius bejariae TaxID=2576383 RepID=A0A844CQD2_9RHOB|nr:hypothetical protein [Roseovarius bejariae]MRU17067.1 hypothetical protein [Roseovarius bejariae]
MQKIMKAKTKDAAHLAQLYAKALRATGFARQASEEGRDELVQWLEQRCSEKEIWVRTDEHGPTALGHFDESKNEVITVVTRDDIEGNGEATAMLRFLAERYPSVRVRPVTKGGKAVASKCGFVPSIDDPSAWVRGS